MFPLTRRFLPACNHLTSWQAHPHGEWSSQCAVALASRLQITSQALAAEACGSRAWRALQPLRSSAGRWRSTRHAVAQLRAAAAASRFEKQGAHINSRKDQESRLQSLARHMPRILRSGPVIQLSRLIPTMFHINLHRRCSILQSCSARRRRILQLLRKSHGRLNEGLHVMRNCE